MRAAAHDDSAHDASAHDAAHDAAHDGDAAIDAADLAEGRLPKTDRTRRSLTSANKLTRY